MPYPMIQWPRFLEFRERLVAELDCEWKTLPDSLAIGKGEPEPVNYLERIVDGQTRRYAVFIPDNERIPPSVIRSICAQLKVDPAAFGLHLG